MERGGARRVHLVAETASDARDVMVEGDSGIMACSPPWFRPIYKPSRRRLIWPNGAVGYTFSADDPEQLRGPQCDTAWADEIAKWRYEEAWSNLVFGLRLGTDPRAVGTTTPKPTKLLKELLADPDCRVVRGSTNENQANLARPFLDAILRKYRGTRLGRQELEAEMLDDAPGALWQRGPMIDEHRVSKFPDLVRVVVAVDPNTKGNDGNAGAQRESGIETAELGECGIVVAGLGTDGIVYVLGDHSLVQPTPERWGREAVSSYHKHQADRIVGEVNNGGDLVESNIRSIDRDVAYKAVHASRGKAVRAEPVASLAEQGRLKHVGVFSLLEDQLCQWEPGVSTWSPNRLDALVWAVTELTAGVTTSWSIGSSRRKN